MARAGRTGQAATALLAAFLLALGAGCSTKRTLVIDSKPRGARILVNGEDRGCTPARIPFTYYGYFDVRLELEGYESVSKEIEIRTQSEALPIIDLVLEPTVRSRRFDRTLEMSPLPPQPGPREVKTIHERAKAFRERAEREAGEPGTPGRIDR